MHSYYTVRGVRCFNFCSAGRESIASHQPGHRRVHCRTGNVCVDCRQCQGGFSAVRSAMCIATSIAVLVLAKLIASLATSIIAALAKSIVALMTSIAALPLAPALHGDVHASAVRCDCMAKLIHVAVHTGKFDCSIRLHMATSIAALPAPAQAYSTDALTPSSKAMHSRRRASTAALLHANANCSTALQRNVLQFAALHGNIFCCSGYVIDLLHGNVHCSTCNRRQLRRSAGDVDRSQ
jgi:hypothetical protein